MPRRKSLASPVTCAPVAPTTGYAMHMQSSQEKRSCAVMPSDVLETIALIDTLIYHLSSISKPDT